jgi:TRAP-type C4-dicarboxylate transport system permease small subunit
MRILDRLVGFALAVGMAAASLAILAQVFLRYVLGAPISWAEEFAVLVFAWLIFLGAARVQRDDSHLSIDLVRRSAGPRLALALDRLRLGLIAACSLVVIWQGIALSLRTLPLEYPAMGVSRAWLYAAAPVGFAVGLVYVAALVRARRRDRERRRDHR